MSERTENKYLVAAVKVDGEEVMARIRPFGGDRDMTNFEKQIDTEQKYYHGCYSQPHIWGMPEEFNSCPICRKTDHMRVTAQKRFDEACHECGYIIKIECSRCMLAVNQYSFKPRDYWDMRADLRQKWNRMGNRRTS